MNRQQIADLIVAKIDQQREALASQWAASGPIHHVVVDELLPLELAQHIAEAFPEGKTLRIRKSLRELKFVTAQMNLYKPLLEETLFAFQDPRVVRLVEQITKLPQLDPDEQLYAGGISVMAQGHFLNPHLDNSHDKSRSRYRVLNLLYYAAPDWVQENGGNLELWPYGPTHDQITINSRFNRLVVMITNTHSWHSVSPVTADRNRYCVSNYYFSERPAEAQEYFHITTFRGRPGQVVRDLALQADALLRTAARKVFPTGIVKTKHFYDKSK